MYETTVTGISISGWINSESDTAGRACVCGVCKSATSTVIYGA